MLVSPTEPKYLREGWTTSSAPERYGVDFLFPTLSGLAGVQRKEVKDLVASLRDGRLEKELGQMQQLAFSAVVIEGKLTWTINDMELNARNFSRDQWYGVQFSILSQNVWLLRSDEIADTKAIIGRLEKWLSKERHGGLRNRPKANGEWGVATNREWAIHMLQSFDGIGPEMAASIFDHFGRVPLAWTATPDELQTIRGIGKGRVRKLWTCLDETLSSNATEDAESGSP